MTNRDLLPPDQHLHIDRYRSLLGTSEVRQTLCYFVQTAWTMSNIESVADLRCQSSGTLGRCQVTS